MSMLLANMAKSRQVIDLASLTYKDSKDTSKTVSALNQLIESFIRVVGDDGKKKAKYDYLAYVFEDLAMHMGERAGLVSPFIASDGEKVSQLSLLMVFTEHPSTIRRRGVAGTIKNMCFDVSAHEQLLAPAKQGGVGILPYILLPLMGNEDYSDDDTEGMPDECQLLPPDKTREPETDIICTHLESLLLLTTMKAGREKLRGAKVYPIVRELHLKVEDQDVRDGCDRVVQVLMRDEEDESAPKVADIEAVAQEGEETDEDEDEQMIEVL